MKIRLRLKEKVLIDIPQEKRFIISDKPKLKFNQGLVGTQKTYDKPNGLWYGIGDAWINHLQIEDDISSEMQNMKMSKVIHYLYEIEIVPEKILFINNEEKFKSFYEKYKQKNFTINLDYYPNYFPLDIDWKMVSNDFSGIEINPFFSEFKQKYSWYYAWDVASGCVWKKDAIKSIKLVSNAWYE